MRRSNLGSRIVDACLLVGCVLCAALAGGCGPAAAPPHTLAPGQRVTAVEEAGAYTLVEAGQGSRYYVPSGLLKHRNTAARSDGPSYTHTIVQETPAYAERPSEQPAPPEPRDRAAIDAEQNALNALFIGETTGKEVIAPRNVHYFVVAKATGERCWRAFECTYPDCPGEKTSGRKHHLFIIVTKRLYQEEPTIQCDACLKLRDLAAETLDAKTKWTSYARPFELPETIRRTAELDREQQRLVKKLREQAGAGR